MICVLPMAGEGRRFKEAGYPEIKPMVPVNGIPMLHKVVKNIQHFANPRCFLFVTLADKYRGGRLVLPDVPYEEIYTPPTRGTVETVLKAARELQTDEPVLVANCDQMVDLETHEWRVPIARFGSILTFSSQNPAHSYVDVDGSGRIKTIREKDPYTRNAVVGLYYFARGYDLVTACYQVVRRDETVKGEFYLSSALQQLIDNGKDLDAFYVNPERVHMLGTPEQLAAYLVGHRV